MNNKQLPNLHKPLSTRQQGMTLVTSLIFLVVMSIAGMMASKLSIVDTLIAKNNKEKILIYQETANDLKLLATIEKLHTPMVEKKFDDSTGIYVSPRNTAKPQTT